MTSPSAAPALAQAARRVYVEALVKGSAAVPAALVEALQQRLLKPAEPLKIRAWRDTLAALQQHGATWQMGVITRLRRLSKSQDPLGPPTAGRPAKPLSLVEDDTIEREILASRLALSIQGDAQWQLTDMRTRMQVLEGHPDLDPEDKLHPAVMARLWVDAWREADLGHVDWQQLQDVLHHEFGHWMGSAYHLTNRWLLEQGVLPDVDLRPFIVRSVGINTGVQLGGSFLESTNRRTPEFESGGAAQLSASRPGSGPGKLHASASTPQRAAGAGSPQSQQAFQVLEQLHEVLQRQMPSLAQVMAQPVPAGGPEVTPPPTAASLTPRLQAVIQRAQGALQRPPSAEGSGTAVLEEMRARSQAFKQVLKQAAGTPEERATIEIVAMMFQSILQDDRLPATVRVWFARLQMPVLRVAVAEPDFFAANDHPARLLIDRMGACVLGFDSADAVGDVLEREIKRVVQVVEAYPDTGRRVFQTVLTEFEQFLSNFFEKENPLSRKGVSLAQQVEQRETLAIQYTIELRKMLADMPVDESLRDFLFQVWADVLAVTAVREGSQAEVTRLMKRAAADLIWSAGAKGSPEERAEVIRRLPVLLKTLRDGMSHAGIAPKKQDEHIRRLNNTLAAAFTAKAAPIPRERLEELMDRLQTLESMLPGLSDIDLDEGLLRDISGHETEGLEVVGEGGSPPSPAMLAWARELPVGSWYRLQFRGRSETVQLAWAGARHQLLLFVSPQGRAVLFPLQRLAAFLQASLMQPAQDESVTVKATRDALARLESDPEQLLR
ncbi:DUF1631 family protein [Inhella sp.]|uniref:DUF1631 family protein n=1 Tax=Inhella sp. TaxID=1921806 RepID=UPI0035B3C14D